jgi:predicted nucleic acid-binding protein
VLYLDSSALIKHYQSERGTDSLDARLDEEARNFRSPFTSVLTYAEVQATFARRRREGFLSAAEFGEVQDRFDADWVLSITPIDLNTNLLGFVRNIVSEFPLRGADAIHLASVIWLRDVARLGVNVGKYAGPLIFASSDKQLAKAALKHQIEVFDPEKTR